MKRIFTLTAVLLFFYWPNNLKAATSASSSVRVTLNVVDALSMGSYQNQLVFNNYSETPALLIENYGTYSKTRVIEKKLVLNQNSFDSPVQITLIPSI